MASSSIVLSSASETETPTFLVTRDHCDETTILDCDIRINNDTKQTIFFRFANGKSMTLAVNPKDEIFMIKQMLLQKITLYETMAAIHGSSPSVSAVTTTSLVSSVMSLLWLSSLLHAWTSKLRVEDLMFVWSGKPLDDDLSFSDYCCYYNNNNTISSSNKNYPTPTIHVSVRMKGGCFMVSATVLAMIMTAIVGSTCTCGLSLIAVPFLLPLLFILPFFCL